MKIVAMNVIPPNVPSSKGGQQNFCNNKVDELSQLKCETDCFDKCKKCCSCTTTDED